MKHAIHDFSFFTDLCLADIDAERFEHLGNHFKDTCLRTEFGYYRKIENNTVEVYKAWVIKPHYYDYPYSIHKDSDGALIGYDNGIRYFK